MRLTRLAIATAPALFVLLWSTGFIGARYGLSYIEPLAFLAVRIAFAVLIMAAIAIIGKAQWPDRSEVGHSIVAGSLVHGLCLGGAFTAISQGVPAGITALILGLQPIVTSTFANRFMGEKVTLVQWAGLGLGLIGVLLVLHDRSIVLAGSVLGWVASFLSLIGITLGTLYQKRYCGSIDWRAGNLIQYVGAGVLFALGAFAFETREIHWTGELIFAMAWLVLVLSVAAVGLMYWLIRRSAATGFASLFYLVPAVTAIFAFILFGERLDALSVLGMVSVPAACCWPIRAPQSLASFDRYFPRHELDLCHQRAKPAVAELVTMSTYGTKRTSLVAPAPQMSANDPKRTYLIE
jgi:drug/metabolite transporter (DMT)-like permease